MKESRSGRCTHFEDDAHDDAHEDDAHEHGVAGGVLTLRMMHMSTV